MMLMKPRIDSIARIFTNALETFFCSDGFSVLISFFGIVFYGMNVYKFLLLGFV